MSKVLLIDGNSIMNRAFYGLMNAGMFRAQDGTYTNAIYGFLNIFFKAVEDYDPEYIAVAFDKGKKTVRHKGYSEYKAGRHKTPEELIEQMPIIKEILQGMNIPCYEMDDYEADDILGTLAKTLTKDNDVFTYILTGDRDYFQLIDNKINIIYPKTSKNGSFQELWDEKKVLENYGNLMPLDLIEVKALMGDASDNIPGVRGIGEKTAVKLINEYGNIDNLYTAVANNEDKLTPKQREKIVEDKDNAFLSRRLGKIITDVDFEFKLEDLKKEEWSDKVKEIFIRLNLKTFLDKFNMLKEDVVFELDKIPDIEKDFSVFEKIIEKVVKNTSENSEKKKVFFSAVFEDEIEKLDEKGKKIKQEEINIMDRELASFSVYLPSENKIFVLDLFKDFNEGDNVSFFDKDSAESEKINEQLKIIKKIFENESFETISFGMKDVLVYFLRKGFVLNNISTDLKIAEYLIDSGINKYEFANVASKYLDPNLVNLYINEKEYGSYLIHEMYKNIMPKVEEEKLDKILYEMEMPLLKILVNMTHLGIRVDTKKIEKFGEGLEKELDILTKEIYELAGEEFNINSPKQLGVILFEKLALTPSKKTKTGYATDIKILEKLIDKHEIIEKIIEYRGSSKLLSTYVSGFLPYVNKKDGRVHGRFHQTITRTGRISSSDPNMQNIPIRTAQGKVLRESFIPKEGYVFVDSDYSQIELRVLAHIAKDEKMIKAFKEGEDIHRSTASHILNKDIDEVTDEERSKAKAVNFGIIYGISSFGLSEQIKVSVKEAQIYIDEYLDKYEGIKRYMDEIVKTAKESGYVETLFGRKRYIEEIASSNYNIREFGKRAAMNTPIQGTAADIVKLAMVNVQKRIKKENIDAKILLQIHDEILLEVKKGEEEIAGKILKEEMENIIKLDVPLIADVKTGDSWLM